MSQSTMRQPKAFPTEQVPSELMELERKILDQPREVRSELQPLLDEVMEHTVFRNRVMLIARDALERMRVDMAALQFELDATRREQHGRANRLSEPSNQ
jgi:hypothetical protein